MEGKIQILNTYIYRDNAILYDLSVTFNILLKKRIIEGTLKMEFEKE